MPGADRLSEAEWIALAERYCFRARLDRPHHDGPIFERGAGSLVWDVEGKEYIDFNAGQICGALGHSPPRVVEAVIQAARTHVHSSSTFYNTQEIRLAEKLVSLLPAPLNKAFFGLSGSDAAEGAINVAKKVTGRYEIASPHISFHGLGDTPRALSFAAWRNGIAPPAPGTFALIAPYCFRCPIGHTFPNCDIACLHGSLTLLEAETSDPVAAIITEPLFSAGGVVEPPPGWLTRVQEACRDQGALLILDESQTGLGKLGTMWGFEPEGIVPDIVMVSKHFGGGIPISAVVTTDEIEQEAIERGFAYAHSHSSDPFACAAAYATLVTIEEDGLVERSAALGQRWRAHLESLQARHDAIRDVRGRGTLQAVEFSASDGSPAYGLGAIVQQICLQAGLLFSVRRWGSVLRFTIPLTTTDEQLARAADLLDDAIGRALAEWRPTDRGRARAAQV